MNAAEYVNGLFNLEGRVGIVTGATRGIGMGIAKVLTDAGATVYNLSRSPRSNDEAIVGKMADVLTDITDKYAVAKCVAGIIEKEGKLDFLVNNAGMQYQCRAETFDEEHFLMVEKTNLNAVFDNSCICFPHLRRSRHIGRIVNISSMAGHLGFGGVVPYCMTKHGVIGLTKGLAEEWKNDNLRVNSIAPGWFMTKLTTEQYAKDPGRRERAKSKIMLGEFGRPVDVGHMALFLLSEAAAYLTGQDFAVDGGALAHGY
jgi:NAD(P)-dependent dehydrogenase (short-subunit alcohol dehydrogenase family)